METAFITSPNTKNNLVSLTVADDLMQEMKRSDDEIRQFAFHLFQHRGAFPSMELQDWLLPVAVNIAQDEKNVIVHADVPKFNESDLKVRIDKHCTQICGETGQPRESHQGEPSSKKPMCKELSNAVDAEHKSYRAWDGVLVVTIPKLHNDAARTTDKKAA